MLRSVLVLVLLVVSTLPGGPAVAADVLRGPCDGVSECPDDEEGDADASSGGGEVRVRVESTWTSGGEAQGETRVIRTRPLCWWAYVASGQTYAKWWRDGGALAEAQLKMPPEYRTKPFPNYQEHADDDKGGWYVPMCGEDRWAGDPASFYDFLTEYLATHGPTYVEDGDDEPAPAVPPELLAEVAYEAMELPLGDLRWNPRRDGDGSTIVGLDTWVWLEDAPANVSVTASVPGTWARVDATLAGLTVDADDVDPVTCDGPGTPWAASADADDACRVVFRRSSANQSVKLTTTVTATAQWTSEWVSSEDPTPRELPSQPVETTAEIPVAEIQSLVDDDD